MKVSLAEIAEYLSQAQSIVLTAHVNPDGDAIGSCLAMFQSLKNLGKEVHVCLADEPLHNFAILPNFSAIVQPPAEIREKLAVDVLLILDTSLERIGTVHDFVAAKKILNVDHHVTNRAEGVIAHVAPERAATAEIVYSLLPEMHVALDEAMATCIYAGLATDTGFFRFSNVTPQTLRIAADLVEHGAKPAQISEAMDSKPYARVVGMARAVEKAELLFDGKLAALFLDENMASTLDSTEGLIDFIRVIEGTDIALLLKWKAEGCRVSMRSKKTDVSRIAAKFGGGGHIRAAGCTLKMPFDKAKAAIVQAIGEALEAQV